MSEFLENFPTVTREQAVATLEQAKEALLARARPCLTSASRRRLRRELFGHDVRTALEMGWASKTNGELLTLAVDRFDVFLTADRNVSYQQDLSRFDIAIVVIVAASNRFEELRPLVPHILNVLPNAQHRQVTMVRG